MNPLNLSCRLVLALAGTGLLLACPGSKRSFDTPREPVALQSALAAPPDAGFLRAFEPKPFRFPEEHAPHPGFRTEWWYATGNLVGAGGERFGFQLTFFRHQLLPQPVARSASLATSEVWMAHAAVASESDGKFLFKERFARSNQVEVKPEPFLLRMGSWAWQSTGEDPPGFEVRASAEEFGFFLRLKPGRGPILQGEGGLSRKGPEPGNASYYYSLTRLPTEGTLELGGRKIPVRGSSWIDREWSTSVLPPDVVGWDWMALELEDGRDLMLYRLRRANGSSTPESQGAWIHPDGSQERLGVADFSLQPRGTVQTRSGTRYPEGFRISLARWQTELELVPLLADQELQATVRYWEGAVRVLGQGPKGKIRGSGFLEMTGYADRKSGSLAPVQPGKSSACGATPR